MKKIICMKDKEGNTVLWTARHIKGIFMPTFPKLQRHRTVHGWIVETKDGLASDRFFQGSFDMTLAELSPIMEMFDYTFLNVISENL